MRTAICPGSFDPITLGHLDVVRRAAKDYARQKGACALVKGVRNGTDFDWEDQMAWINRSLAEELETVLLPASPEYSWFSSTMAREMIRYGQDLTKYLPSGVAEEIRKGMG